jgi:hypothetical protein
MDEWMVIVDWTPLLEARPLFKTWLAARGLAEEDVDPMSLRVDTGRGVSGDVRRYRVSRSELTRLNVRLEDQH